MTRLYFILGIQSLPLCLLLTNSHPTDGTQGLEELPVAPVNKDGNEEEAKGRRRPGWSHQLPG